MAAFVETLNVGRPFSDSVHPEEAARTPSATRAKSNLVRSMRIPLAAVVGFLALAGQSLLARSPELPAHLHQHRGAVLSVLNQPRPHLEQGVPNEAELLAATEDHTFGIDHPDLVSVVSAGGKRFGILRVEQEGRISYMVVQLGQNGEVLHAFPAGRELSYAQGFLDTALTDDSDSDGEATLAVK